MANFNFGKFFTVCIVMEEQIPACTNESKTFFPFVDTLLPLCRKTCPHNFKTNFI